MGPAVSDRISRVPPYSGYCSASMSSRVRDCHPLWYNFPDVSTSTFLAFVAVLQPSICRNRLSLGCCAFARHYLRNHYCFLFLRVLRCFSSPRLLPCRDNTLLTYWVAPFGDLGFNRLFAPRPSFSQLVTSFFASESLGIRRLPLFTCLVRSNWKWKIENWKWKTNVLHYQ